MFMENYNNKTTKYFIEKNLDLQLYSFDEKEIPLDDLNHDLNQIDDNYALNLYETQMPHEWKFLRGNPKTPEEEFREWKKYILLKKIEEEIKPLFIDSMEKCDKSKVIKPYDEPDLEGLNVDEECLVDINEFLNHEIDFGIKCKYSVCLPLRDSMIHERIIYSFLELRCNENVQIKIRLDPLIRYPIWMGSFERLYGKKINWNELSNTKTNVTAEFMDKETGVKTQIFWKKMDDGRLQFFCEELPLLDEITERGSRFFHAIYDSKAQLITHFDASTIIYSEQEFIKRNSKKLWDLSSKLGKYCKIYRIYGEIDRDLFAGVVVNYFVHNDDVKSYFDELSS